MTKERNQFLIDLIDRELNAEEQCDMLYHQEYIRELLAIKEELLRGIYKGEGLIGGIMYSSIIEEDKERYIIKEG